MTSTPKTADPAPPRLLSIDLVRGADVLLMLFVNEVAGVTAAPAFLLHTPSDADGMTVTDVVFPAFLFVVGLAVPFALGGRLRLGEGRAAVFKHVLARTLALLVMGVFTVNAEKASPDGLLSPALWNVLMTLGVLLTWQTHPPARWRAQTPSEDGPTTKSGRWRLRALGIALLVTVVVVYRSTAATGPIQLRIYWWGILGLIGWAYLVGASLYLVVGERTAVLVGSIGLLYCLYLADAAGGIGWLLAVRPFVGVGSMLGSHAAVVVSGTVLGVMLARHRREGGSPWAFTARALGYAAGLAAAGLLLHSLSALHPAFWINKVKATPPWCLLASALTCVAWVVVYLLVDVRGWRPWSRVVSMAGENALIAYLLAPFLLSAFALSAPLLGGINPYAALGEATWVGLVRSAVFAWAVVRLCGLLASRGLRVQL